MNDSKLMRVLLQESNSGIKGNSDVQVSKLEKRGIDQPDEEKIINKINYQEDQVSNMTTDMADTINAKDLKIDKADKYATSKNSANILNNAMDKLAKKPYEFAPVAKGNTRESINRAMDVLAKKPNEDKTIYPK